MIYTTKAFWLGAGERAIKTVAQAGVAVLGSGVVGLFEVDGVALASTALLAGVVSLLTSVASPNVASAKEA